MLKRSCALCKVVGAIAILGALNLGLSVFGLNPLEQVLGVDSAATRVAYGLVGVSGLLLLVSYFYICPACRKTT